MRQPRPSLAMIQVTFSFQDGCRHRRHFRCVHLLHRRWGHQGRHLDQRLSGDKKFLLTLTPTLEFSSPLQAFCMLSSALVVVVVGEAAVGGSKEVFKANYESGGIELLNLDASPLIRLSRVVIFGGLCCCC